jgi:hypothetical protein
MHILPTENPILLAPRLRNTLRGRVVMRIDIIDLLSRVGGSR